MLSYGGTEIPQQLKVNWNGGCCFAIWLAAWLPCSLSELPGRLPAAPWQLLCLSFACLSPVFRLCFAIGTLTPVFRYRSPHPPLPSRCLPMSAGFCRQNPDSARILPAESGFCRQNRAESGFCRDSAGRNPVHIFPPDSTGINPDSAGEERYFHMSAEFCPDSAGINCHEMWGR